MDLILIEGFKAEPFPKIELHRPSLKKKLLFPDDPNIIAIATDTEIKITPQNTGYSTTEISNLSLPTVLNINNPYSIAEFILSDFLGIQND